MKSMTGYAYREADTNDVLASVEIKGYNSRFLELSVYLPPYLSALEREVREIMSSRCGRGKVEVTIRLKDHRSELLVSVNTAAARAYEKAISALAETFHSAEKPDLRLLLGLEGVLEIEKPRDDGRCWSHIEPLLVSAADAFDAERLREGIHTRDNILDQLALLERETEKIDAFAPALETSIKENIKARFTEVLGNRIDENRVLAETAVLLMKYTINEELSRLSSHFKEFREETERNSRPGKKLDFLCQEINREINTIGSKTPVLEVSRGVVNMKNALENIREQLRNVE